jgi:hypothetical protein
MGINGTIEVPVWNNQNWVYYGNSAVIDEKGNIFFRRPPGFTKAKRDAAPANFKFDPEPDK